MNKIYTEIKVLTLVFLSLLQCSSLFSQYVIEADPALPLNNQAVTITFFADRGNKGLVNYTADDVYAYTGVLTDKSTSASDWKHIKAEWSSNTDSCKMNWIAYNKYELNISPGIREFYNVPADEKILKLAFVFRNANADKKGRDEEEADIFYTVYEEGINVAFISPARDFTFVSQGMSLPVKVAAMGSDSVFLYKDQKLIKKTSGLSIDTSIIASDLSKHFLIARAKNNDTSVADTILYIVPGVSVDALLPEGIEDGITYINNDSVVFSLHGPGKNSIYLIGDFNNWLPDSTYQLKRSGDKFWTAIGGLTPGKEYAFQYLIDQNLRIADPYAEKILDPFNDKEIPHSVYPNLKEYPSAKTSQLAGVIQPGKPDYIWDDDGFIPPDSRELIIYELLIRDFVSTHDIKSIIEKLDYLQTLGVNAIELMPFSEFEGNSSWGYNPSFYFATDKYYGRDIDFKDFIQECHNRGIAVIMDIVLNHAYGQNPMVRMYYNSATGKPTLNNPWFNQDSPNTAYSWGYDFNHESLATQYFVDRVVEYWLTEYKIDGFRFDFTKGFTNTPGDGSAYDASRIAILKRIYDKLHTVNSDAYMICEHFAPNSEEKILSDYGMYIWGNINYNFNEATMGYLNNSDLSWASYKSRGWSNPTLVSYMESHDEERMMFKNITYGNSNTEYNIKDPATALKRQELAGVFFFTIPGPKMIWQFGELGYDVSIDFNDRVGEKPIKWEYWNDYNRQHLYLIWAKILDIRKKYPVFTTEDFTLSTGNMVALKKIILRHTEEDAIVIGNFGLTTADIQPGFTKTGWWYELFTGDSIDIADINYSLTLHAGEYRIYASKKMESVINGTEGVINEPTRLSYPNPVNERLYIALDNRIDHIKIFDLSGTCLIHQINPDIDKSIDVSILPEGIYLLMIQENKKQYVEKFMKK